MKKKTGITEPNIQRTINEALAENGLDTELIIRSLVEDIKSKPTEKVAGLLLASKLLGLLDRAKQEDAKAPVKIIPSSIAQLLGWIENELPEGVVAMADDLMEKRGLGRVESVRDRELRELTDSIKKIAES